VGGVIGVNTMSREGFNLYRCLKIGFLERVLSFYFFRFKENKFDYDRLDRALAPPGGWACESDGNR
jgi:hypothetical protein